jgi:hypothetical protein
MIAGRAGSEWAGRWAYARLGLNGVIFLREGVPIPGLGVHWCWGTGFSFFKIRVRNKEILLLAFRTYSGTRSASREQLDINARGASTLTHFRRFSASLLSSF